LLTDAAAAGRAEDEGWRVRKDGSQFWASVVITALYDDGGKLLGFAKVTRDLTQRRAMEEAEHEARVQAEQSSRLKDEFLATVSHELRTPLNVLVGTVWRLRDRQQDAEERGRLIAVLERSAMLLTRLVKDLLDTSEMIAGRVRLDLRPVELGAIVESAIEVVEAEARDKGVAIHRNLSLATGPVLGDAVRLQQIVWNLVINAIKFTETGGTVEVTLARVGAEVMVSVSDTGRGIATDFLPHVFDRFAQADRTTTRSHGGMGLGLAIVRHLAEAHGGRVVAASAGIERGATFSVYLPVPALLARPSDVLHEAVRPDR